MISIVIPCYNASLYIERLAGIVFDISAIASEILLVDDCSVDDTYRQAVKLGLPIVKTPHNMGPGGARNFGVQFLEGEWVHFLDADDLLSPEVLRKSTLLLDQSLDVLLIGANWVDEVNGDLLKEWSFCSEYLNENPLQSCLVSPIPCHCSIIRIDQFRAIGGFLSSFRCWEDGDLHLRLVANGARVAVMDAVLTTSIRHRRGASSNHLYCHRCRFTLLKGYVDQQLPIKPSVMANELMVIGNMLLGERCLGEALKAYQLAHRLHPIRPQSNQKFVRLLMALFPPPRALLMQQWLRQALGQYFRSWK